MKFLNKILASICMLILTISMISCQNKRDNMEWKIIDFDKIPGEKLVDNYFGAITRYEFNQIINYNKDVFFLLGDDSGERADNYNAIVYSTKNFGDSWKKNILGKGTVKYGLCIGNDIFIVVDSNKIPTSSTHKSTLYLSNDFGDTWSEITHLDEGNISNLDFYSQNTGIAVFSLKKNEEFIYEYRYTKDSGKTWSKFDLDPDTNCIMNSDQSLLYIEDNNKLFQFNIETGEKKLIKSLSIPKNMDLAYIKKDKKTDRLIAYYFGKEQESNKIGICYIDKDEYVSLPDNYYITTHGNFFYGLLFNRPFSTYVWSSDGGKTWKKEVLDNQMIYTDIPMGYYGEGYIYIEATPLKIKNKRGTFFVIGNPNIK